jgi:hypothetical protein
MFLRGIIGSLGSFNDVNFHYDFLKLFLKCRNVQVLHSYIHFYFIFHQILKKSYVALSVFFKSSRQLQGYQKTSNFFFLKVLKEQIHTYKGSFDSFSEVNNMRNLSFLGNCDIFEKTTYNICF